MRSRMTKLAAALILIAAAILGVHAFNGTPVKAVEFSEIARALGEVPWMHTVAIADIPQAKGTIEQWIGFKEKVEGGKMPDGRVSFRRLQEHEAAEYDPNSNTITLSYAQEDDFSPQMSSPALIVESMQKTLKEHGAEIVTRMGEHQGRKVQVQEVTLARHFTGIDLYLVRLYVDPQSKLLCAMESAAFDANDVAVSTGKATYDYPLTGPRDIYDLGVPRDAKIVNNMPAPDLQSVLEQYQRSRVEATNEYIAIVTYAHQDGTVRRVDVDYKSGREERLERHEVFSRGEAFVELWPKYREQLGDSFESLWAWSRGHYETSGDISVRLYDGRYEWTTDRGDEGQWSALRKQPVSDDYLGALTPLREIGWPRVGSGGHVIEDSYAKEKGLICIESLQQGRASNGVVPPMRLLYYLDPGRDYLCQRHVIERRLDADWQENEDWLTGVDPTKVPESSTVLIDITEAIEAPNGYWYPHVVVESECDPLRNGQEAPAKIRLIKTVYVEISPTFPEGIFDVNRLPGQ